MRLHTELTGTEVYAALRRANAAGRIPSDVDFEVFQAHRSTKRSRGFEIQLGTYDQTSGPTRSRHYKNSGTNGAGNIWAATYDEWGWFIAEVMAADPEAIFGPYNGREGFNEATNDAYVLQVSAS